MPVRKYRHVGEMDRDIWYRRGDPRLFRAIRAVWNFAQRIVQPKFQTALIALNRRGSPRRYQMSRSISPT